MTMVVCKVLLGAILTLFNLSTASDSRVAQENVAGQNVSGAGGAPHIENAKMETHGVAGTLAAAMADLEKNAAKPTWVGYSVRMVAGERTICCGNYDSRVRDCGKCALEIDGENYSTTSNAKNSGAVKLEDGEELLVLFRMQDRHVTRVKMASDNCVLDAGGLPLVWLTGVQTSESVTMLTEYVRKNHAGEAERDSIGNEALTAIALHDGAAALSALESFGEPAQPEELRKQASFWLGAARGKEGFAVLQRMAKTDPSTEVRAHVAFALSISKEPAALEEMIRMAHEDESGHVRGQAIFWLAQKAGKRAMGAIDGAIENDPDTDVKKQAVFALSQLPKDEGVPKLIQVAQTNRNPVVRKQAMFWLGQSEDARALDFFEKVLTK
jgi:hypothetical protein